MDEMRARATRRGGPNAGRAGYVVGLLVLVALLAGCSPEADRMRGGGLGADVGNTTLPIELRGDRSRNNPSFETPRIGQVPNDAKGVQGWWIGVRD